MKGRRSETNPDDDPYLQSTLTLRVEERELTFQAPHSVFSSSRIDGGTRLLLENLPDGSPRSFLDLGCGYGALGLPVAARFPESVGVLVDRDLLAVEFTRRNAALEAIDLALFREHLAALLAGREVATPRFDFPRGRRKPPGSWVPLRLTEHQVLVIEGIHGLNDGLTEGIDPSRTFRIFISALSQLAIDDHNRIFTADARLIRRIVRDRRYRGFTAERTLELWEGVRRGEARWIFPFQEQADVMFNSALVYEPAVLKTYAERFLLQVPRTSAAYPEAFRLLKFLSMFVPVFPDEVPQTSILREFIGGSGFDY